MAGLYLLISFYEGYFGKGKRWPDTDIRRDRLEAPAIYGFEAGRSRVTLMSICPQTYDDSVGA